MRLLVLSDLHLDIWCGHGPKFGLHAHPDVVILAGDIHAGASGVQWAAETFPDVPVLYVMGNHEAYGYDLHVTRAAIHAACTMFENVHFLDDESRLINGVRFIGSTLWTDFYLFGAVNHFDAMKEAHQYMNDYRAIEISGRSLQPGDTKSLNQQHVAWIENQISVPFDGKTVVITHMAPSVLSVPDRYRKQLGSSAFASNLDELVTQADLWIHGHTHDSFDYMIGDSRVVCNPCGYPRKFGQRVVGENEDFNPNLIIEI